MQDERSINHTVFRDCFSAAFLQRITPSSPLKTAKRRSVRSRKKISPKNKCEDDESTSPGNDAGELSDFIDVIRCSDLD